ncbi:MAG: ATP-binding protein [Phycisphaerae bacterium]|nr:ATP-binding protein [Phycisphaerae bacterium]
MVDIDLTKLAFESVVIGNDLKVAAERVVRPILTQASRCGYCSQDQFALRLALEESLCNAFRHGNGCDPDKRISARWAIREDVAVICVADEGDGFDPSAVPDPRREENREKPYGRGVMLMRAYMTELRFNEQGNEVCMIKVRKRSGARPTGT